jgi:hypothetical protein
MYCPKPKPFRLNRLNRLSVHSPQGDYDVAPGEKNCSTGIVSKLDIERDTEDVVNSPGGKDCSTGIVRNPVSKQLSLIGNKQPLWEAGVSDSLPIGTRVCHKKSPSQVGSILKPVEGSTRYHVRWDAGSTSSVEGRNLSLIPVEQLDYRKLLTVEPDYLSEENGQLTIFSEDEPPEPDDFNSLEAFEQAWNRWELQYPQLAEAVRQSGKELQTIPVEQKSLIPVEQPAPLETIKVPQTQTIKVITLKQPWAWVIFNLGKDVENRFWSDSYRGILYIHAGKSYDEEGKAWIEEKFNVTVPDNLESGCIVGRVELVDISRDSFGSPWSMIHQWHWKLENPVSLKTPIEARGYQKLWNFETLPENLQTQKLPKTRNTKPGRGSRPKQVKCNVKRNNSKSKVANTYWVYKFSFKVDGKYYDRSVSIPKEKVNRVIEMWESKQYSWRDIVECIGKSPDKIVDKVRFK